MSLLKSISALLFVFSLCACDESAYAFLDSQGRTVNPADWRNKWVIINYWADWCGPCAEEIPELNLFYQRHHGQTVLIGVNNDQLPADQLASAMRSLHILFPVLQTNPARALGLPALEVIPTTFIINPQGKLIQQLAGPQTAAHLEEIMHVRS